MSNETTTMVVWIYEWYLIAGVYELKCHYSNKAYVDQSGSSFQISFNEQKSIHDK